MFNDIFKRAIKAELSGVEYYLIDGMFYIYQRDAELLKFIAFQVRPPGDDFSIVARAKSFSEGIIQYSPYKQLNMHGHEVNWYAKRIGVEHFSNKLSVFNPPWKYNRKMFLPQFEKNLQLCRDTLFRDLAEVNNLEDYYNFEAKIWSVEYSMNIPQPSLGSFYLCIQLNKIFEASVIAYIVIKDEYIGKDSFDQRINSKLHKIVSATTDKEKAYYAISNILNEYNDILQAQIKQRIADSRSVCDNFINCKKGD